MCELILTSTDHYDQKSYIEYLENENKKQYILLMTQQYLLCKIRSKFKLRLFHDSRKISHNPNYFDFFNIKIIKNNVTIGNFSNQLYEEKLTFISSIREAYHNELSFGTIGKKIPNKNNGEKEYFFHFVRDYDPIYIPEKLPGSWAKIIQCIFERSNTNPEKLLLRIYTYTPNHTRCTMMTFTKIPIDCTNKFECALSKFCMRYNIRADIV